MGKRYRLAVLNSHPVQYFAPLYKQIAETPDIDITVYYCSQQGLTSGFVDPGFGKEVVWDTPLLEGYRSRFLANIWGDRGVRGFFSLANFGIVGELRRERFDAILLHGHNSLTNLLALTVARLTGTKVLMRSETHLLLRRAALKKLLRRPLMTLLYRLCDACLFIGTRNREFYEAHGVPPEKLYPVPYVVDNDAFARRAAAPSIAPAALRERLMLPPDIPIVLYASKLIARKRPRDLLFAALELERRGMRFATVFVGDGIQRASLEAEANARDAKNVVFAGFANQLELPSYFAAATVFVLPSEDEPWGLVINEAMACGVPVVASTEIGAVADLVDSTNTGRTYKAGDVAALADSISTVMSHSEVNQRMREKIRIHIASWSFKQAIDGIRAALVGVCTSNSVGP